MTDRLRVALAGNPNSGKTTLFNALTGARQHVGNYPGVTVEKKVGVCHADGVDIEFVDLPGAYSLSAYSLEELVARDYIIESRPDVVVDVLDASNLERNLYLAVQLLELHVPLVLALNMSDVAEARGHRIDVAMLSKLIGCPIVSTVGSKEKGLEELLSTVKAVGRDPARGLGVPITYGEDLDEAIARIEAQLGKKAKLQKGEDAHWLALKLLENDEEVKKRLEIRAGDSDALAPLWEAVAEEAARFEKRYGDAPDILISERRYGFIAGACQEAVVLTAEDRLTASDKIDNVVTNRVLGIPIFLGLMYLVFQLTFVVGAPFMEWLEAGFGWLGAAVASLWPPNSESWLKSLIVDGVIGGVGGVLVFVPNIVLLFLAIALLEDSGYMARVAFIMDRVMHKIGLHGKSFIPLLIGFGCTIPAIMATRTIENRRDRMVTMLVAPLMSCGARLPIYALLIPAFFPQVWQGPMLWIIYVIGVVLAIMVAKLLRSTLFRGESAPFVMELPPYRLPTFRGVFIHMWERVWLYVKKAGTIILAISVVLWALSSFPAKEQYEQSYESEAVPVAESYSEEELQQARMSEDLAYSVLGRIGTAIEPLVKPMGFDWKIGTASVAAFAAKEVFVAQMGIIYSVGEADETSESLRQQLQANYTPLVAFCIMLWALVSAPCMATIAVTKRESNSWKWALFQLGGLTLLAYVLTVIVFQVGSLLGIGTG